MMNQTINVESTYQAACIALSYYTAVAASYCAGISMDIPMSPCVTIGCYEIPFNVPMPQDKCEALNAVACMKSIINLLIVNC